MCYNQGMNLFGIILFAIGVVAAFGLALTVISRLKTIQGYRRLRRWRRIAFNTEILLLSFFFSVLVGQIFLPDDFGTSINGADEGVEDTFIESSENESKKQVILPDTFGEIVENELIEKMGETSGKKSASKPSFTVWSNVYKGFKYSYVEVENGVPYVYAPTFRGNFAQNINNIRIGEEGKNILVIANAGVFEGESSPVGAVIQNGNVIQTKAKKDSSSRTLVMDEGGNVGYTGEAVTGNVVTYTDAITGKTVEGRKIVSAVTGFTPIVINGKVATKFKKKVANYADYRARTVFCVRKNNAYTIITNTGEGENGGWDFGDMAAVALRRDCQFAFDLDGGGSTALAWRTLLSQNFNIYATTIRKTPTYIVFTADNLPPATK